MLLTKDERYKEIRTFYARDRGLTTMEEIVSMLEHCCKVSVEQAVGKG
jgi:hypothetical protein